MRSIPHWRQKDARCPQRLRHWLLDRASLTQRLRAHSNSRLSVVVLSERWARPRLDEAHALALPSSSRVFIREVVLYGDGQAWVYARSVLPASVLRGAFCRLRTLGARPLGELLFKQPSLRRGTIMQARWPHARLPPSLPLSPPETLWARRSLFCYPRSKILVCEVFLPALIHHNKANTCLHPKHK